MGFYLLASLLVVGRVAGLEDQRSVLTPLGGDNKASWEEVREAIDRYLPARNVNVNVGGPNGDIVFRHDKGELDDDTEGRIFSATKWISGVTVLSVVADSRFKLELDDLASDHLAWWSTDRDDLRSGVTLRHLLGFTSGIIGIPGICPDGSSTFLECCETTYGTTIGDEPPGEEFTYLEIHVQLAACIAVAATGEDFATLVQERVLTPSGMRRTTWLDPTNVNAGSGLVSTPGDYKLFLRKYFLGELLPRAFHLEMERDQYPLAIRLGYPNEGWHYGLTNWYECPVGVTEWGAECEALKVHSSGGTAGFRPQVNRQYNYYLLVGYYGQPGIGGEITREIVARIRPLLAQIFAGPVARAGAGVGANGSAPVGPALVGEE